MVTIKELKNLKMVKRSLKRVYTFIHGEILEIIHSKMLIVVITDSEIACDFYFKIILN